MDGTSSFPSRPEMERNLATFVERTGLPIRFDTPWESTSRDGERFVLHTPDGDYRCQVAIFAVGVAQPFTPDTPGFELAAHYVDTRPAETYAGKRLFIVGKENSGFELATGLLQWAQRIVLASPRPAKLSINSHSLAGVRARYVLPVEDEILGGGVFILNASIARIERMGDTLRVHCIRSETSTEIAVDADEVIAATGFTCPLQDLQHLGVEVFGRSQLPAMTNYWESATAPGIYFAGTIGQGVSGMKKYGYPANSGAVHGARYNARTMVQHVAQKHFGVELPRSRVLAQFACRPLADGGDARARAVEPEVVPGARVLARPGGGHPGQRHRAARPVRRRRGSGRNRDRGRDRRHGRHPPGGVRAREQQARGRDAALVAAAARLPDGRQSRPPLGDPARSH